MIPFLGRIRPVGVVLALGAAVAGCDDDSCPDSVRCPPASTTTVESTTSTLPAQTTTTLRSTTTSTVPPFARACAVYFRVDSDSAIGSLKWDTDYGPLPGEFSRKGKRVECASLVADSLGVFDDEDDLRRLHAELTSPDGFLGPHLLAVCGVGADSLPLVRDFAVDVREAVDPTGSPIVPLPAVVVDHVDCNATETTVTRTTFDGCPGLDCYPPSTEPPRLIVLHYAIAFHLDSASEGVGSLQLGVDYARSGLTFDGSGSAASCTNQASGALFAPNDEDLEHRLRLGFIALTAIVPPSSLAECRATMTYLDDGHPPPAPVPGDFVVSIEDANDVDGKPVDVQVGVAVTLVP